jgi:hypothetical protein
VTNKLVIELRKAKQRRTKLAFLIQSELTLLEEDKVGDPAVKGIVDFAEPWSRSASVACFPAPPLFTHLATLRQPVAKSRVNRQNNGLNLRFFRFMLKGCHRN